MRKSFNRVRPAENPAAFVPALRVIPCISCDATGRCMSAPTPCQTCGGRGIVMIRLPSPAPINHALAFQI